MSSTEPKIGVVVHPRLGKENSGAVGIELIQFFDQFSGVSALSVGFFHRPACFRPKTALFRNFVVRQRVSLFDVQEVKAAETITFLELIEELLVSASGTAQSPAGLSGWERAKMADSGR